MPATLSDDDGDFDDQHPGFSRLDDIAERHGLSKPAVYRAFHSQDGLCFASGYPMAHDEGDGWYSVDAVSRVVHRPLSNSNFRLVCTMIARMKPDGMRWEQFSHVCSAVADNLLANDED